MSRRVFVSFRYSDGAPYKERLDKLFYSSDYIINCSENIDRSSMSESTIRNYLYGKLDNTSVTILILSPMAINHHKNWMGQYDDWIYDELRYSLEDRIGNRTNGIVAVYTKDAQAMVIEQFDGYKTIPEFDNLARRNMFNVKPQYKKNPKEGLYDSRWDSYCSLVSWEEFVDNYSDYIESAAQKRNVCEHYNLEKRM